MSLLMLRVDFIVFVVVPSLDEGAKLSGSVELMVENIRTHYHKFSR